MILAGGLLWQFMVSPLGSASRIRYSTLFNPDTITTVSGEVIRVTTVPSGNGRDLCVQALVRTPQGEMTAVLAPKSFLTRGNLAVSPRDRLNLTGSLVTIMNQPYLLVTEVTGDRVMKLREPNGRSYWAVGDDWHVH